MKKKGTLDDFTNKIYDDFKNGNYHTDSINLSTATKPVEIVTIPKKSIEELKKLSTTQILDYLNTNETILKDDEFDKIRNLRYDLMFKENNLRYGSVTVTKIFDGTIIATGDFAHVKAQNILHNITTLYQSLKKRPRFKGRLTTSGGHRCEIYETGFKKKEQFSQIKDDLRYNKSSHIKDDPQYQYHHYIVTENKDGIVLTYTDMNQFVFGIVVS